MPSSVYAVSPQNSATEAPGIPSCGEIFVVKESLLTPYHNLLAAAARTPSVRTSPACRKIVESICSSSQSSAGGNGRRRPGIICLPPAGGESLSRQPWLYLMGTFDGYDETTLPKILKDFAITVRTSPAEEEGKSTIRTSPDWRIWPTTKTQWVVVIPMTPESGKFPVEPWMCFGDHNLPYTMEASEIEKLDAYSKERLRDFSYKLVRDHTYLTKVAIALRDHEAKVRLRTSFCVSTDSTSTMLFSSTYPRRNANTLPVVNHSACNASHRGLRCVLVSFVCYRNKCRHLHSVYAIHRHN